jgi:hypothetical protein
LVFELSHPLCNEKLRLARIRVWRDEFRAKASVEVRTRKRGTSVARLVRDLLGTIAQDGLTRAILDDAD